MPGDLGTQLCTLCRQQSRFPQGCCSPSPWEMETTPPSSAMVEARGGPCGWLGASFLLLLFLLCNSSLKGHFGTCSAWLQHSPLPRAEVCCKMMPEMIPQSGNSALLHRARVKTNPHGFGYPYFCHKSKQGWMAVVPPSFWG